jgi:hypothetical protein
MFEIKLKKSTADSKISRQESHVLGNNITVELV